jgi:hypothetical protein
MKSNNFESKIRSKILIIRDDLVLAVCKGCGAEVEVPLRKSAAPRSGPPLILSK